MRDGKMGGHMGIYRVAEKEPEQKGFFSVLMGC
jgi:hypothetical protein